MKDFQEHRWWWTPNRKSDAGKWRIDECKNCGLLRYGWEVNELGSYKFEWYFTPSPPGRFYAPHHLPKCRKHED